MTKTTTEKLETIQQAIANMLNVFSEYAEDFEPDSEGKIVVIEAEEALDLLPSLIAEATEREQEQKILDERLVEKLAGRINSWRATGLQRTPHAEALDWIEFVTSHYRTVK